MDYKAQNDGQEVFVNTNDPQAQIIEVSYTDYEGNEEFSVMDWQEVYDTFMLVPSDFVVVL